MVRVLGIYMGLDVGCGFRWYGICKDLDGRNAKALFQWSGVDDQVVMSESLGLQRSLMEAFSLGFGGGGRRLSIFIQLPFIRSVLKNPITVRKYVGDSSVTLRPFVIDD